MKYLIVFITAFIVYSTVISAVAQNKVIVVPLGAEKATGDAVKGDVLSGKTFSSDLGTDLLGTRPPAPVPVTGQSACYDKSGTPRVCIGMGEDGEYRQGATAVPRFTDNNDGTITDNRSGLIWLQDANCIHSNYPEFDLEGSSSGDGAVEWQSALYFVAGMNADWYPLCSAGRNDWRLPNVNELHSLVDFGNFDPALPTIHPFLNIQIYYWSSSTFIDKQSEAWYLNVSYGGLVRANKGGSILPLYVWPVAGP